MFRFTPPPHLAIKSSLIAVSVALSAFSLNAHALAVTNVTYSVGSLTNLSVNSASSSPFKTVVSSYADTDERFTSNPYTKVTDDKKGTITTQTLQDREEVVETNSYKFDSASAYYSLNATTANAASVFRFNTTLSLDQAQTRGIYSPYFSFDLVGDVVGGSALSDVPGLTAYQAPIWAVSVNGGAYTQLASNFSTYSSDFSSNSGFSIFGLDSDTLSSNSVNLSFLVYTSPDLAMDSFLFSYASSSYDWISKTTTTPLAAKVWDTVITTYEVSPIPEPEYGAMLLAGLAVVGAASRRQAKNA